MTQTASHFIDLLHLEPHPEGGFYRETYRSSEEIKSFNGIPACAATTIYYMLQDSQRSAFHRIDHDEQWFFHAGNTLQIDSIQDGEWKSELLGSPTDQGASFQVVIPANTWFTAQIKDTRGFCLVSCVVAPGFEFAGFELADEEVLTEHYPHLAKKIKERYR